MNFVVMARPPEEEPPPKAPTRMRLFIGGFFDKNYELTLENGQLKYRFAEHGGAERVEEVLCPSAQDWAAFWKSLGEIGVWAWEASYDNPSVQDGTQWGVEIEWGPRRCEIHGSNASPKVPGVRAKRDQPLPRLLRAISRLAGGRAFE
jgi:hypothetical protein